MRWFRFYSESLNDPKVLRLTDRQYRVWTQLLCIACDNDGLILVADLPILLRMKQDTIAKTVAVLITDGLFDHAASETFLTPHNWNGRQYKSDVSTDRVQRFRKRDRNVSETPSESDSEQIQKQSRTETDTDTEQPRPFPRRAVVVGFEQAFGRLLSQTEIELIRALEEEHPSERLEYALREAAALNKRSVRYVQRTCERMATDGDSGRTGSGQSAKAAHTNGVADRVPDVDERISALAERRRNRTA